MSVASNLAGLPPALAIALAGGSLVGLLWLGWCKPTWTLLLALASLSIRPQLLWGGSTVGHEWGLHQTLLVWALAVNALHFGLRRTPNWPILALLATFCLSLAFGHLYPTLRPAFMLTSLATLALPFAFTQVVLEPGSRRACALVIMLTPLLSVALGAVLQLLDVHPMMYVSGWNVGEYRLHGAAGIAAVFAMLAFAGFAVALHESTRPGRRHASVLAAVNLILVVLSGTRMAMLASAALLVAYALASPGLRTRLWRHRGRALAAAALVALAVAIYWPSLELRLFSADAGTLRLSGRDTLWSFYLSQFALSPWFGRGIGTGFLAGDEALAFILNTPHNEYLHLLVNGGLVGFALAAGAIVLWYRELLQAASPNDRAFLIALIPAWSLYASTDNVLGYPTGLALFAYVGVLLTRPGQLPLSRDSATRGQREALATATQDREGLGVDHASPSARCGPGGPFCDWVPFRRPWLPA